MGHSTPLFTFGLLLVLGLGAAWIGFVAPGPQADTLYQYDAIEVYEDDDGGLAATWVDSGNPATPWSYNLDDEVACLPQDRHCAFERRALHGQVENRRLEGHDYLYHVQNATFYVITSTGAQSTGFEAVNTSEVLEDLSSRLSDISSRERDLIESGSGITRHRLEHANEILRHEGGYYALVRTGISRERGCFGGDLSFCDDASWVRTTDELRMYGVGVLGLLGILVGAGGIVRTRRHSGSD